MSDQSEAPIVAALLDDKFPEKTCRVTGKRYRPLKGFTQIRWERQQAAEIIRLCEEALTEWVAIVEPTLNNAIDVGYPNERHVETMRVTKAALAQIKGQNP